MRILSDRSRPQKHEMSKTGNSLVCVTGGSYIIIVLLLPVDQSEKRMEFIKGFFRNLALLILIGLVLFFFFPGMMKQVFQLYGALLGPVALFLIIVIALPHKQRGKR